MVYILMGVSGCGKTTIGTLLSRRLGLPFYDGDDFHPERNIRKMRQGLPLDDDDRGPWLNLLAFKIKEWNATGGGVLACSALKKRYRDVLSGGSPEKVLFIHLDGDREKIIERVNARKDHFMPSGLLMSQFNDLEKPDRGISSMNDTRPEETVSDIVNKISLYTKTGHHNAEI